MEGFDNNVSINECENNNLCVCEGGGGGVDCTGEEPSLPIQRRLHNAVSYLWTSELIINTPKGNM